MAYATASDDVQPRIAPYITLTTISIPTLAQVGRWLDETSAKVDVYLKRAGYTTIPVTDTGDLLMLRGVVADKVALQALYVGLGADQVPVSASEMLAGFRDFLAALKDGDAILTGETPTRNAFKIVQPRVLGADDTYSRWLIHPDDRYR